jgi:hypothetical protein
MIVQITYKDHGRDRVFEVEQKTRYQCAIAALDELERRGIKSYGLGVVVQKGPVRK